MVSTNLSIYEMIFKILRSFLEHIENLSVIPFGKYFVLGFGSFVIFSKKYLIPKRFWRKAKNLKKS